MKLNDSNSDGYGELRALVQKIETKLVDMLTKSKEPFTIEELAIKAFNVAKQEVDDPQQAIFLANAVTRKVVKLIRRSNDEWYKRIGSPN